MPDAIEVRKVPIHSVVRRLRARRAHRRRRDGRPTASSPSSARPRATAASTTTPGSSPTARSARCWSPRAPTAEQVKDVPIVWSGGTDGVISPHATIFATMPPERGRADRRAAAHRRLRDERGAAARGHRPRRDGREGRRRGARSRWSAPASPTRPTCTTCRPRPRCSPSHTIRDAKSPRQDGVDRAHPRVDGPLQRRHRARHRRGARRDRDAHRRRRHARPLAVLRRWPRAPRASSSTRPRSSWSATRAGSAAATGSGTR